MPNNKITIKGNSLRPSDKPIFQKCSGETSKCNPSFSTWFTLRQSNGTKSNLVFKSLNIRFYEMAISFNGDRTLFTGFNSHNEISDVLFENIGKDSTAIVRFVNSRNNVIKDSYFVKGPGTQILHAVYLAHYSSNNKILNNRFEYISGDPIRIRDDSNNNLIDTNIFVRNSNGAAVVTWFCDKALFSDCTKPAAECPSFNNRVVNNTWDRLNFDGTKSKIQPVYDRVKSSGMSGCSKSNLARITTSNNKISTDTSCEFNGAKVAHGKSIAAYLSNVIEQGQTCKSQNRSCSMGVLFGTYKYSNCSAK